MGRARLEENDGKLEGMRAPCLGHIGFAALLLAGCGDALSPVTVIDLSGPWMRATPTQMGIDSAALERAASAAAAASRCRSLLVARHGRLVLERYFGGADSTTLFDVRSVTKSVVSALVGIAIAQGRVPGTSATVGTYFGSPDTLDTGDRAVTVAQLLTMTSGYSWNETTGDDYNLWILSPDHVQFLLDRPQTGPPGPFTYNSAAVHLLGVLVQHAVGMPLPAFSDTVLFQPIGVRGVRWETLENGTVNGGSGLALTGRDLLRYGQLVLQHGQSDSHQVIPASWVDAMTGAHFGWRETDGPQQGVSYGYLWWTTDGPPASAVFAWGYGGQFLYVVPSLDLVAVATTAWQGLTQGAQSAAVTDSTWAILVNGVLPAVR
jgi:CubicO group peptidase (beta-lactamase class C family)